MKTILLLTLVLMLEQATAQDRTFNGFYVTPQHDTIKGAFPKYKEAAKSPEKIQFVPNGSATPIQLTPLNCLEATITDYDQYLSYTGKRLINPIDDNVAMDNRGYFDFHDSALSVTAFVRLVTATPQCSIYILNDHIRTNFFYQLPGEPLQELRFKKYFDENNMHELADYRQQLNNLFADEIAMKHMSSLLEELPYSEDGLSAFIQKLSSERKPMQNKSDHLAGWIINAGASANSLNVTGDQSVTEAALEYKTSYSPYVSIGYYLPIQRNFNRFFFYPQLRLFRYKNLAEKTTGSFNQQVTYKADLVILPQVNIGANIINKAGLRFFIYGGAGMTAFINNKEINEYITPIGNALYTYEYELSSLVLGLNLSSGITIKNRFQFIVSYNLSPDIDSFPATNSKPSNLQAGIGYKLGKH